MDQPRIITPVTHDIGAFTVRRSLPEVPKTVSHP